MSEARVDGTLHVYEEPERPLAMTLTVFKLLEGPFFRLRVTGPEASIQEMLNAEPAVIPAKDGLANLAALATVKAAAAARMVVNCILTEVFRKCSCGVERIDRMNECAGDVS